MALSYQAIYPRVKDVIASVKNGLSATDIRASFELAKAPLRFTFAGKVALKGHLESAFSDVKLRLTESDLEKVKTVRDIAQLVHKKVQQKKKAG